MKALAQLPYSIVFALTVGLFMGIAVFLTEPIWAAVLSLVVGCSLAHFLAQIIWAEGTCRLTQRLGNISQPWPLGEAIRRCNRGRIRPRCLNAPTR
jgi:hypothetical protein